MKIKVFRPNDDFSMFKQGEEMLYVHAYDYQFLHHILYQTKAISRQFRDGKVIK